MIAVGVLQVRDPVWAIRRLEHRQCRFARIGETERFFYLLFDFAQARHLKPRYLNTSAGSDCAFGHCAKTSDQRRKISRNPTSTELRPRRSGKKNAWDKLMQQLFVRPQ